MGAEFYTEEEAKESKSAVHLADKPAPELQIQERINPQENDASTSTEVLLPTNTVKPNKISTTKSRKPKHTNGPSPRQVYKWVPRNTLPIAKHVQTKPSPRVQHQQKPKTNTNTRSTISQRQTITQWIPKVTLQEQGYYKGHTMIWLPKKMLRTSANIQKPMVPTKIQQHTLNRPTKVQHMHGDPNKSQQQSQLLQLRFMLLHTYRHSILNQQGRPLVKRKVNGYHRQLLTPEQTSPMPKQLEAFKTLTQQRSHSKIHAKTAHQLAQQLFCFNRFAILQNLETLLASQATNAK